MSASRKQPDLDRASRAVAELLAAFGLDETTYPELRGTPTRVARAWAEDLLGGYDVDVAALLRSEPATKPVDSALVVVRRIPVTTMCPHHLLPARGIADLGYLPSDRLFGIGNLIDLVDALARRAVLQEELGDSIVDALVRDGGVRGAVVAMELEHACVSARGPRATESRVRTLTWRGVFVDDAAERTLALEALR